VRVFGLRDSPDHASAKWLIDMLVARRDLGAKLVKQRVSL